MSIFNKLKEPIFLKEGSDAKRQLEKLKQLEPLLNSEGQTIIRQDIKYIEYGIIGEDNIAFELRNSHIPMYILHDIFLQCGELSAQIDYLVVTRKIQFVIECKNLYGDLEITNMGDFIRTMRYGNKVKKEGIYSPITQNERHLELIKKIKVEKKKNILSQLMTQSAFGDFHKSVVVLANPKTVLNAKYAKKEIKEKVIRADQLIKYIKKMNDDSKELASSDKNMLNIAQRYLDLHKEVEKDYTKKYEPYLIDREMKIDNIENNVINLSTEIVVEDTPLYKELKLYRLEKSRQESIKPYIIYSDAQMNNLIKECPKILMSYKLFLDLEK